MKRTIIYIIAFALAITSCSTTKNTRGSRSFHGMKVVHNVYFNGNIAFALGQDAIDKANEDDFSSILNLYPISNPKTQQSATSDMDKCIEKCRKSIKLHSIHAKPKRDSKRMGDPEYRLWLEQKEFNSQMYRAWLLLGQAEFHKGEFLGSIGTFSYVSRLYENDKDIVAQCHLWIARAYGEMGWIYEAEDALQKVKIDDLKENHKSLYSAVSADILLKGRHYKEAIPYVRLAAKGEKKKGYRPRFEYVLGQLYQMDGQIVPARAAYKRVWRMQPSHALNFNAHLRYAELMGDTLKTIKSLKKMARRSKNKEYQDQLYGTIGNLYLLNGDTIAALVAYETGIKQSTRNGMDKAAIQVKAGDIYYERHQYEQASPCYKGASEILPFGHIDYTRVKQRAEILDELVKETKVVTLQDSLQRLGKMSPKEQEAIVAQIIKNLIAQEQADSTKAAQEKREKENAAFGGFEESMPTLNKDNSWYFYNADLLKKGTATFRRTWGNRPLEDDWRRLSKANSGSSSFSTTDNEENYNDSIPPTDSIPNDSLTQKKSAPITDIHKPEYYLQQIPVTEEDYKNSDLLIQKALYNLVYLYQDKVNDPDMSALTLEEYYRRFPNGEELLELYFMQYLQALREKDESKMEKYKQAILRQFPTSDQATIVSDPDYVGRMQRMTQEQDSLYALTFDAYKKSNYTQVKNFTQYIDSTYPLCPLMPNFLFLNAISTARTDSQERFAACLTDMVTRFPNSELSAMAKNMLAMMGEGLENKKGGDSNSLEAQRAQQPSDTTDTISTPKTFSTERQEEAYVLAIQNTHDEQNMFALQYQIALFNFSQFMIKDFDIRLVLQLSKTTSAVVLSGFDSMKEAEWYIGMAKENNELNDFLQKGQVQLVPITQHNFQLLGTLSLEAYLEQFAE